MLPTREQREQMIAEGIEKANKLAEEQRIRAESIKLEKLREERLKNEALADQEVINIERSILHSLEGGKRSHIKEFGNGKDLSKVMEIAIEKLKRANPDYVFELTTTSVHKDNFMAAANVEGVDPCEWWEPVWQLKVTW